MKSFQETAKEIKELGFRTAWLETSRGVSLVGKNQPRTNVETQLEKIGTYLEKATLVDGWYIVKAQPNISSKDLPVSYKIWVGQSRPEDNLSEKEKNPAAMNQNFSIEMYLRQMQELATAQAELVYLRKENERLQARVEHLEETNDGLREGAATMAAGIPTPKPMIETLSEIFVSAAPLVTEVLAMVKANKAEQAPAPQNQDLSRIAAMLNKMQQQQNQQAATLAEMQRRREPTETQPKTLTVEELANMVIEGELSEQDARKVLEGQPAEVVTQFDNLIYED